MKDLLTIDEVCEIAKVSKPTVYRRVRQGSFPAPKKIPSKINRGPRHVNRWERGEVMGWLLKGNDPNWMKQPVKEIQATCAKIDNPQTLDETVRKNDGATDFQHDEAWNPEEKPNYLVWGLIGGALSGLAWALFGG